MRGCAVALNITEGYRMPGQDVRRREDFRFITGRGRYTDDVQLPELLHAHQIALDGGGARRAGCHRRGAKGVGEAGTVGSLAAVMNAVCDALSGYGLKHLDMPATPQRVWAITRGRMPQSG
jgi:CO/xanthine dehydrogenase Mo-binding subunit